MIPPLIESRSEVVCVDPDPGKRARADAELRSAHNLFGVVLRELAAPEALTGAVDERLTVRLRHRGTVLRLRIRRRSSTGLHRFAGPVEQLIEGATASDDRWAALDAAALAVLVAAELTLRTGHPNGDFVGQVTGSRDALADVLRNRPRRPARPVTGFAATYLDSEQSLLGGHPRHPAPKWRSGDPAEWGRYSPELRTAFPLRWLAAPAALVHDHSLAAADFDGCAAVATLLGEHHGELPAGYQAVPVHPWQFRLIGDDPALGPALRRAVESGRLRDLGEVGSSFHPTASVRTVYQPDSDVFLKTSLNVQITNCVRRNAVHELAGAVELTRLLAEPLAEVRAGHPGFAVLTEPAARTITALGAEDDDYLQHAVMEAFGTICRTGLRGWSGPSERIHLAGALAAEHADPAATPTRLADLADAAGAADAQGWALDWWARYVALLVPPVLRLWAHHGVVLEPHLQNVLVVVGSRELPVRVLGRDMEGTKLVDERWRDALAELPSDVARAVGYTEAQGWHRVAYCLFVNNLTEVAAALADLAFRHEPSSRRFEAQLWDVLHDVVASVHAELGEPPRLRALLAGCPLPAKANLLVRWAGDPDRLASYVPFPNPLGRLSRAGR